MAIFSFIRKAKRTESQDEEGTVKVDTLEDVMNERRAKGIADEEKEPVLEKLKNLIQTVFSKKDPA